MLFDLSSLQNGYYENLKGPVDFTIPIWYAPYFNSIGFISLVLSNTAALLIIFKSEKLDNFKYFLFSLQVSSLVMDFHLSILCQPIYFLSAYTVNCIGVAAPVIWCNSLMALEQSFNCVQYLCLLFCFMRRHQSVANITSRHVIPARMFQFLMFLAFSFPPFAAFFWYHAGISEDLLPGFIDRVFPEYKSKFSSLHNFTIYQLNFSLGVVGVMGFTGIFVVFQAIAMTTMDTMKMLKGARKTISAQSYDRQRSAMKSLIAQFLASCLLVLPAASFYVISVYPINYGQEIVNISMAIFATRSSVNAVILVATTPPYRAFLFGRIASSRQKAASTVVVSMNTAIGS